jgi:hypothetical protein
MELEKELRKETKKWLDKIKEERKGIKLVKETEKIGTVIRNIDAYIDDANHFIKKGLHVQAFEAVIYAYGLLDAIKTLKIAQTSSQQ